MRVLQVNNYGFLKGGSEKVFLDTISALEKNGHQVLAFCMSDDKNYSSDKMVEVSISPYENRRGFIGNILAIKNFLYNSHVEKEFSKLVSAFKPDIIHIHIIYGRLTNAIIKVANRFNIPIVQSVHEFRLLCPNYTCLDRKGNICETCATSLLKLSCVRKKCSKGLLSNSLMVAVECLYRDTFFNHQKYISGFIMVSKFIQDLHVKYYPEIRNKCYQVYNSIDVKLCEEYVSYNKYNSEHYYLYFGRLSYEKGILTLVDFFKKHPHDRLKIVGIGPLLAKIKESTESLPNIEVLGYKAGKELYNLIANAYFTIVPSEWYENNPLTIIESLALGTPVIGNNIGGIPEIVVNSKTGYVYDYTINGDLELKIQQANNLSEDEYNNMQLSCIAEAKDKFDSIEYCEKICAVYDSVIQKSH